MRASPARRRLRAPVASLAVWAAALAAPSLAGAQTLRLGIYQYHGNQGLPSTTMVTNAYNAAFGASNVTITYNRIVASWPTATELDAVDVLWMTRYSNPTRPTAADLTNLVNFVRRGGQFVFVGETEGAAVNTIITGLGLPTTAVTPTGTGPSPFTSVFNTFGLATGLTQLVNTRSYDIYPNIPDCTRIADRTLFFIPGRTVRSGSMLLSGEVQSFSANPTYGTAQWQTLANRVAAVHRIYLRGTQDQLVAADVTGTLDMARCASMYVVPPPVEVCGNGMMRGAETCDDGNTRAGDGCSAMCAVEAGWRCTGAAPSVCVELDTDMDGLSDNTERDLTRTSPTNPDTDGDGLSDGFEVGANPRMPRNTDGDMLIDALDVDDDNDTVPTRDEVGPDVRAPRNTDGADEPDYRDTDDDNDRILTRDEVTLDRSAGDDLDRDMLPSHRDTDSDGDTIPDTAEAGPDAANPVDSDRDGDRDFLDLDSDNDCLADRAAGEAGAARTNAMAPSRDPNDNCTGATPVCNTANGMCVPDGDSDMDGLPNLVERRIGTNPDNRDSDGDGLSDGAEVGDAGRPTNTDGDMLIDALDADDDNDSIATRDEVGDDPRSPRNTDGADRPDHLDTDDDNDGIPTRTEATLDTAMGDDTDGDRVPSYRDLDSDGDMIPDAVEAGADPTMPVNTDGMGLPDFLDTDSDDDGLLDAAERGTGMTPQDSDMDGRPDYRDDDDDGDSIATRAELGPDPTRPRNTDGTDAPDHLDPDDDNDGLTTLEEARLDMSSGDDYDGDGVPSYRDTDSDDDGLVDMAEGTADRDMNSRPDFLDAADDSDGDGLPNSIERGGGPCPDAGVGDDAAVGGGTCGDRDTDMDGRPDFLDPDDDGDTIPTAVERSLDPSEGDDLDRDMLPSYRDLDADGDGVPDREEAGATPAMPANTDGAMDNPDFLDRNSDNDCLPDNDPAEAGAARVTVAMNPNAGCMGDAPTCDLTLGVCVRCFVAMGGRSVGCEMAPEGRQCLPRSTPDERQRCGCGDDSHCLAAETCDVAQRRCVARPMPDAAVPDAPAPDAPAPTPDAGMDAALDAPTEVIYRGGGCGCSVDATTDDELPLALGVLAGVAALARRRRRRP